MNDGFRSISLAARKAPSVGFVRLVAGVIQKMLRSFDHESKGDATRWLGAAMRTKVDLWGVHGAQDVPGHE